MRIAGYLKWKDRGRKSEKFVVCEEHQQYCVVLILGFYESVRRIILKSFALPLLESPNKTSFPLQKKIIIFSPPPQQHPLQPTIHTSSTTTFRTIIIHFQQ